MVAVCETGNTVGRVSKFRFPNAGFFAHMEITELTENERRRVPSSTTRDRYVWTFHLGNPAKFFQWLREPQLKFRFNIAPTQPVASIGRTDQRRELSMLPWGLVPFGADDPKIGHRMVNARAENGAQ